MQTKSATLLNALRLSEEGDNRAARVSGGIWLAAGLFLLLMTATVTFVSTTHDIGTVTFIAPMMLMVSAVLVGLGTHRLIWGHPKSSGGIPNWGRVLISVGLTCGLLMFISALSGFIAGLDPAGLP
jgi:hypothetical protein